MIRSYQVLRILFYARISSCVLKGFRIQCRVFSFFHFYRRESKDRDSFCNHFGYLKQIANFSHPLLVEVFERTGSA